MNDAKRIDWIDAAKGIGIIAVVVGHVVEPTGYLARTLYSFHMPLFFVISGYLFNFEKNDADLPKTIKTKFHHLMIPYFVCGVSVFSIWLLFSCPKPFVPTPGGAIAALASQCLVSYLYGIGQINVLASLAWITPVGTAWFLAALFCTEILFLFFFEGSATDPCRHTAVRGDLDRALGRSDRAKNIPALELGYFFRRAAFRPRRIRTKATRLRRSRHGLACLGSRGRLVRLHVVQHALDEQ